MARSSNILWFTDVDKHDVGIVGGKGANLGEMAQAGFPVPNGFIVTARAYFSFLRENKLIPKINQLLKTVNYEHPDSIAQVSAHIKRLITQSPVNEELIKEIYQAYTHLGRGSFSNALVAVRSSATAEDLPEASFAGQQETYLNVQGDTNVIVKIRDGWASLFEPRAIFYRHEQKFDHFRVGIAIVVQKMIESETSGVMFTLDPVTNDKTRIIVEAIKGLGEMIVQGKVTPDHYEVQKSSLEILKKHVAEQDKIMHRVSGGKTKETELTKKDGGKQKISDKHIIDLARLGKKLEKHYYFPQDIEWAIEKDHVSIVQTRAVTTTHTKKVKAETLSEKLQLILKGAPASPGIGSGPVMIINQRKDLAHVQTGDVLVAPQTNPDYVPAMKKASAIVTDKGGRTSHAAIVSRELGIPAVVGTGNATRLLKKNLVVSVDGAKGEVYKGASQQMHDTPEHTHCNIKTRTKVYVNLAEPSRAEAVSQDCVDGIGLLRAEFMMADIGVHPMQMIKEKRKKEYSDKLAEQIAIFCKAFAHRPVVYRASDFKTNEYRGLKGGKEYEPEEPNPMLGFRGAYRYINNPEVFKLELDAIKKVRDKMDLKNLWVMIPFIRSVSELREVKHIMIEKGLSRTANFKLWLMVEIPSTVILLEDFINLGIDGVSIGSNDLTMLLLGTDRDNSEVANAFDELNPASLWAFEKTIKTARKHGITASICGQAPSVHQSLVDKLVSWGITSVSVTPDMIDATRERIAKAERKLVINH